MTFVSKYERNYFFNNNHLNSNFYNRAMLNRIGIKSYLTITCVYRPSYHPTCIFLPTAFRATFTYVSIQKHLNRPLSIAMFNVEKRFFDSLYRADLSPFLLVWNWNANQGMLYQSQMNIDSSGAYKYVEGHVLLEILNITLHGPVRPVSSACVLNSFSRISDYMYHNAAATSSL